jgi:hypothetical protein
MPQTFDGTAGLRRGAGIAMDRWRGCGPLLAWAAAIVLLVGCLPDGDGGEGGPPPSGIGAALPAFVAEAWTPSNVDGLLLGGDTLALHGGYVSDERRASLYVTSADPAFGARPPIRELDAHRGVVSLGAGDAFVAWLDAVPEPGDAPRIRVYEMAGLGDPAAGTLEWSPLASARLHGRCAALHGDRLGYVGWMDDDAGVPARVGVTSLADDLGRNPVDLGVVDAAMTSCALGDRLFVWSDDDDLHAVETPFETSAPFVVTGLAGAVSGLRVEGGLVSWKEGGQLRIFDADRPIVAGENPRTIGVVLRQGLTRRYVLYSDVGWDRYYVLDATDASAVPEQVYATDQTEDLKPRIGDRFVVWSKCRNIVWRDGIFGGRDRDCADETDDPPGPDVSVLVLDLEAPRVVGENPLEVGSGFGLLRDAAVGPLGVAWRSGTGRDERLTYWNPVEPRIASVNPLDVYAGAPNAEAPRLGTNGLAFFTDYEGERRQIRFLEAVELLLATRDGP